MSASDGAVDFIVVMFAFEDMLVLVVGSVVQAAARSRKARKDTSASIFFINKTPSFGTWENV
jgi:hypothetical protein